MIQFGREITGTFELAARREWLVTNGLGGWASGTVSGANTRRYHGLFVPALQPPLGRTVLVSKINERATLAGQTFALSANEYSDGTIDPHGYRHIESFRLEGQVPTWTFALADALLEKRVWMPYEQNTTYVAYTLARALQPLSLDLLVMVTCRDAHAETSGRGWRPAVDNLAGGVLVQAKDQRFRLLSSRGYFVPVGQWHWGIHHRVEMRRGLGDREDQFALGVFSVDLAPGDTVALAATLDESGNPAHDWDSALASAGERAGALVAEAGLQSAPDWIQQLALAADQFVVRRGEGRTVLAGYHWFGDWGRDTMIALPGLTLATRRYAEAADILRTFARFVNGGMLPNRFPDTGDLPEYNTVDATLWYFHAVDRFTQASGGDDLLRELLPVLEDIVDWHVRGTRYGIGVDPGDGLLHAGEPGAQLTWMDVKIDRPWESTTDPNFLAVAERYGLSRNLKAWVVTPRTGKPVEINALWINALRVAAALSERAGRPAQHPYAEMAARAEASFGRFWYAKGGYLYDVIGGPDGDDSSLRPNQLIAVALPHGPFRDPATHHRARSVVSVCAEHLLTSYGLRSLSPGHPAFTGAYGGDQVMRDAAYHQGTAWAWLIGPFVDAHLRVFGDASAARSFLAPFEHHLADDGLGTIAEIFEGEPPYAPRGCIAQAWSVAEVLRAWVRLSAGG